MIGRVYIEIWVYDYNRKIFLQTPCVTRIEGFPQYMGYVGSSILLQRFIIKWYILSIILSI